MNVFATNKTSSSITVAGHKAYYIDSTDAEIVEVEGQGGGGSTESDDATGTISGVTLPTAHSYTGAVFDSLRYYAKGTLSNTGTDIGAYFGQTTSTTYYKGTITWTDKSLGDLSDKIGVNPISSSYRLKQTVFRIIFINSEQITGKHPWDDGDSSTTNNQITEYSYNNGVHSITFYCTTDWYNGQYSGRIQFRYLDGTTTFNNLSAFDLIYVSGGSLSKATTTDRYDMYNAWNGDITLHALYGSAETIRRNAFKYTLSGTPYWYVIDGEHDTWTDDLSAWGYSEVPVGPSVGDIITLGKYPQNTSNTPEDIEWIVLAVDASNHKALLISKYILDACKYAQFGTSSTTWKESRARDWLNSTFYDSAFNIFEKRVVIQSNITTPDNPTYGTSGGDPTQDRLFFLSAQEASSLFADDNARKTTATWKARADQTWSDNNYAVWLTRTPGHTNAFVVNVSHGGSVYEVGDDINSTWTGARPSLWFDYAEPIPEPLPAVTLDAGWCTTPSNHVDFPASTTQQARYWQNAGWQSFPYDSTKAYAAWWWNSDSSGSGYFGIVLSDNGDGYFGITNVLSYTILRFVEAHYATCESPDAVAIQVLNSSNVAYAAFKYTRGGIDYYYVLDGTQTDWTDDLAGIGYSLYVKAWFTSDKSGKSIDTSYPGNSGLLYDSQGAFIAFQSGSTYTTAAVYNTSQQAVSGIDSSNFILEDNGGGYLSFKNRSSKSPTVLYVEYIVS